MNIYEEIIYPTFDEIRDTLDNPAILVEDPETILFGQNGVLDSMALVSLIVALEEQIEDVTGFSVSLANEKAMSRKNSPFQKVDTLKNYIEELIEEQKNA